MNDINRLNDTLAVQALSDVAKKWFDARGLQAYATMSKTQAYARRQKLSLPAWASEQAEDQETLVTPESGEAARAALRYLLDGDDPEVRAWTRAAVDKANQTQAQVIDPVTLAVGGTVLIGLILASRVKKIGPDGAEFYEGIDEELAKVITAGTNFLRALGGA